MPASFWAAYAVRLAVVAAVLLLLYAAARALRRTRLFAPAGRRVQLLETTMLAPHAALHVVRFGARYFLIGSSTGSVRKLAELPNELTVPQDETAPARR